MKIFAAGIATETNTFSPIPTGLEDYIVHRGSNIANEHSSPPCFDLPQIWGTLARSQGHEFIFSLMAFAQPAGKTVRTAYEALRDEMLHDLRAAMPVDIVLLMLHGAMVADGYDDCEEDMIRRVREIVGEEVVIGVELDLHCHLSESTIAPADLVIIYKEYPHTDVNDRARELFDLVIAARLGEIHPTMALFDCRMTGLYPTSREPMRGFVEAMKAVERRNGVLSVSLGHGFPFADIPQVGMKMLVITDDDAVLAHETARELGLQVYGLRQRIGFECISLPMEQALTKALAGGERTVVVADQSDNVGGGAPGDATFVLRWLLEHAAGGAALAILYDPEVVKIARKAGPGSKLSMRLGGKLGPASGDPIDLEVTVLATRDSHSHPFPQASGDPVLFPLGDVAALRCRGIDVVVSSERCQCYSPAIFTDLGIDPASKRLLVVKSAQHFYGTFAALADEVIYMSAPGAVAPDPRSIPYQRLDTSRLYPWVPDPLKQDELR